MSGSKDGENRTPEKGSENGPKNHAVSEAEARHRRESSEDLHYQLDEAALRHALERTRLAPWIDALIDAVHSRAGQLRHGDLPGWRAALNALPPLEVSRKDMTGPVVTIDGRLDKASDEAALRDALAALIPWRKGPFRLGPVVVECEWRSDLKWVRLLPHISSLEGRRVLDVGTGSGYHLWRMRGAGAELVLGIEPGLLFATQFELFARFFQDPAVQLLPLTLESLPAPMQCFDTVFSMGVLYHRRDHAAHLTELMAALRPGGELVLETLVSPSCDDDELNLGERYARMRNVHAIPSSTRVIRWMSEAGFGDVRVVSSEITTVDEQRRTPWMPYDSLAEALDPTDDTLTVEGHPRPQRAIVIAQRPVNSAR